MIRSPAKITVRSRRRFQAASLALLWGLYALLGASCLLASASVQAAPASAGTAKAVTSATVCHCKVCHGLMRGGRMMCCCGGSPASGARAALSARCDQGAPAALAAGTTWPVIRPDLTALLLLRFGPRRFARPGSAFALSFQPLPLTPPPCVF